MHLVDKILVVAGFWIFAGPGFAQIESTKSATVQRPGDFTAEVKPVPLLFSLIPGVGSIGLGAEVFVDPNVAVFSDVYYSDVDLPNRVTTTMNDRAGDPTPDKLTAASISLGGRYYGRPAGSSWYAGGLVGYSDSEGQWDYEAETIDHRVMSTTAGLEAGYRWKWVGGTIFRLGGGLASNNVQSKSVTSESDTKDAKDGIKKVGDINTPPVLAALDVGFGHDF